MTPRPFHGLTEIGRARRLRRLAIAALGEYDIEPLRLRLLSNSNNAIFRIDTAREPLVIRVAQPAVHRGVDAVRAEVDFLDAIARDTDLNVPAPVRNLTGELVTPASASGIPDSRSCVVFTWVRGRDLADRMTEDNWRRLGRLMADLHAFAETWDPPASARHLLRFDRTFHYEQPVIVFDHDDATLAPHRRLFSEAHERVDEIIATIVRRAPLIVTHGDLHQWNVKIHRSTLSPIDFEDSQWAAPLLDASTCLYYAYRRDDYEALKSAFRAGYETRRGWVEESPGEIEALYVARALDLANLVLTSPEIEAKEWPTYVERWTRLARLCLDWRG